MVSVRILPVNQLDSAAKIQPFLEELSVAAQGRLIKYAGLLFNYMINRDVRHKSLRRRFKQMKKVIKKENAGRIY